ncbi:MAG: HD domain-containing protein [Lachnospiraceae bacterium]|nr:HD domain-containing protein [Lachnospiraceae bacterium]
MESTPYNTSLLLQQALLQSASPSVWFDGLKESGALREMLPEVFALIGVSQDPLHHPEGDVYIHTMMALDYAAGIRGQAKNPYPFMLSALCHDLGKPLVTETGKDGRIHAYGHEEAGIALAHQLLTRVNAEADTMEYVENMVLLHMKPNRLYRDQSKVKSTNKMFGASVCPEDLLLLAEADHYGKRDASLYDECRDWLQERMDLYRKK